MELQQSLLYQQYIQHLSWETLTVSGVRIFIRKLPLLGALAKIQRPQKLPAQGKLIPALKNFDVRTVAIEASYHQNVAELKSWCRQLAAHFRLNRSPYLPTKTLVVNLKLPVDQIFSRFTSAKRRAVRRAQKNRIVIRQTSNIYELIKIKSKSAGLFGSLTTYGLKELWQVFAPKHAAILLAFNSSLKPKLVGGVLLLFWNKTAYYWIVAATREGKKLFAPTLLVWEALQLAKSRGANKFDFVGIWDERLPRENISWKGFTKFKEGFGGQLYYYPLAF